jgi:hypothetical protein
MVAYTLYPWVRVYVCDACGAPTFDCRSHPVDGMTPWRFMTTQPHSYSHHYKAPADGPHDADSGYLAADDDEPPLPPPVMHVVPPPLTGWLWADFEGSPATYRFLTDCTTLDCHRAVKAIMAKTLYGTVAILPAGVA